MALHGEVPSAQFLIKVAFSAAIGAVATPAHPASAAVSQSPVTAGRTHPSVPTRHK